MKRRLPGSIASRVLASLHDKPQAALEIAQAIGEPRSNVSTALCILEEAGDAEKLTSSSMMVKGRPAVFWRLRKPGSQSSGPAALVREQENTEVLSARGCDEHLADLRRVYPAPLTSAMFRESMVPVRIVAPFERSAIGSPGASCADTAGAV